MPPAPPPAGLEPAVHRRPGCMPPPGPAASRRCSGPARPSAEPISSRTRRSLTARLVQFTSGQPTSPARHLASASADFSSVFLANPECFCRDFSQLSDLPRRVAGPGNCEKANGHVPGHRPAGFLRALEAPSPGHSGPQDVQLPSIVCRVLPIQSAEVRIAAQQVVNPFDPARRRRSSAKHDDARRDKARKLFRPLGSQASSASPIA